jgi:hypothetical protein
MKNRGALQLLIQRCLNGAHTQIVMEKKEKKKDAESLCRQRIIDLVWTICEK